MLMANNNSGVPRIASKQYQWSQEVQSIREEERIRIAREIHDELGQWLTALKLEAFLIKKAIIPNDTKAEQQLSSMIALVIQTEKVVGRIATELRPCVLDDLELLSALEWQGTEFEKRTGIQLRISSSGDLQLDTTLSTCVFRVYQEALTNIARHANATKVDIIFKQKGDNVTLTIKDNGRGFDLNEVKSKKSFGLIGMRERALLFNGELHIESSKSNGTVIRLKVPFIQKG